VEEAELAARSPEYGLMMIVSSVSRCRRVGSPLRLSPGVRGYSAQRSGLSNMGWSGVFRRHPADQSHTALPGSLLAAAAHAAAARWKSHETLILPSAKTIKGAL
jgi:hypothetical protein